MDLVFIILYLCQLYTDGHLIDIIFKMFRCTTFWISPQFSAVQLREVTRLIIAGDGDVSEIALIDEVTHIVLPEGAFTPTHFESIALLGMQACF